MAATLLVFIYIAFISLGLPDSLLGAGWPAMRLDLGAPLSAAGIVTMVITGGTIISSLLSETIIRRFGTWRVTAVSVVATAAALLGFAFAGGFGWIILLAVPLGLGAGAVDAALNNYVALHYKARHMSWLHCFWGIGAFAGPLILSGFMQGGAGWRGGYLTIGIIQSIVAAALFATIPLYNKQAKSLSLKEAKDKSSGRQAAGFKDTFKIPGVVLALLTFVFYCAAEYSAGLWSSSFLVEAKGFTQAAAAQGAALFYLGITIGRFLSGFLTSVFTGTQLIRMGAILAAASAGMLLLPFSTPVYAFCVLFLLGVGCAPVFPSMLHETPRRFGTQNSQRIVGLQMAFAYIGSTLLPPLLGFIAGKVGIGIFPPLLLVFSAGVLLCSEGVARSAKKNTPV